MKTSLFHATKPTAPEDSQTQQAPNNHHIRQHPTEQSSQNLTWLIHSLKLKTICSQIVHQYLEDKQQSKIFYQQSSTIRTLEETLLRKHGGQLHNKHEQIHSPTILGLKNKIDHKHLLLTAICAFYKTIWTLNITPIQLHINTTPTVTRILDLGLSEYMLGQQLCWQLAAETACMPTTSFSPLYSLHFLKLLTPSSV